MLARYSLEYLVCMAILETGNRTMLRRQQRAHTHKCWRQGAMQRALHREQVICHNAMVTSGEAQVVISSIAIHRADCAAVKQQHHFAADSNIHSKGAGFKTARTFKAHRLVHQAPISSSMIRETLELTITTALKSHLVSSNI